MSLLGRTIGVSVVLQNYVISKRDEFADLYEVLSEHKYSCVLLWQQVCSPTDASPDDFLPVHRRLRVIEALIPGKVCRSRHPHPNLTDYESISVSWEKIQALEPSRSRLVLSHFS
jgi:hypothetical protein